MHLPLPPLLCQGSIKSRQRGWRSLLTYYSWPPSCVWFGVAQLLPRACNSTRCSPLLKNLCLFCVSLQRPCHDLVSRHFVFRYGLIEICPNCVSFLSFVRKSTEVSKQAAIRPSRIRRGYCLFKLRDPVNFVVRLSGISAVTWNLTFWTLVCYDLDTKDDPIGSN